MATRQKDKGIVDFYKKLKKRYPKDAVALSRDHKILEHLVFAIFLENATLDQASSCFSKLERYFIDWNEVRVSKAIEIANVIGNVPNAVKIGERLRRLLQWIFDKTFKFDLEDARAKGVGETLDFLKTVPFSTRFMNEYVSLFGFGSNVFPMDECVLRVFRLLGWVEVRDDQEVAPILDDAFNQSDLLKFFFAVHELGCELMDETTQKNAVKFLATIDPEAANRSCKPLVESTFPTDPSEIAKLYAKHERPKNVSTSAMMSKMFGGETMDSDDFDESDDFDKSDDGEGYDPYNEERVDEFGDSDGFVGRRGAPDVQYGSGKRAETTLSKDSASYFESVSEPVGLNGYEESQSGRSVKKARPRKRVSDVESAPESQSKGVKAVSTRVEKKDGGSSSEEVDAVVLRGTTEKKSKEKKPSEKKSNESENLGSKKVRAQSDESEDVKKSSVKKSVRSTRSKAEVDDSKSATKPSAEATEKKKVVSDAQEVSEKKSVVETVKKEKKTPDETSKATSAPCLTGAKSPSVLSYVTRRRSMLKEKEQNSVEETKPVDEAVVKPKRKRESEPPKSEPPAKRSKKG